MIKINYIRLWLTSFALVASMLLSACGDPSLTIQAPNSQSPSKSQRSLNVDSSALLANPDATRISLYDYKDNLIAKGGFTNTCNVVQYVTYQTTGQNGPFDNTSCSASVVLSGITFSQTFNKQYEGLGMEMGPYTAGSISYTLDPQVLQDLQASTGVQLGKIKFDVFSASNSMADSKTVSLIYNGLFIDLGQTSTYYNKTSGDGGIYAIYQMNPEGAADYVKEWTLSTGGQVVSHGSTKCLSFDAITQKCSNNTTICISWDPITQTCPKTTTAYGLTLPIPKGEAGTYILAITAKSSNSWVLPFFTSATINYKPL